MHPCISKENQVVVAILQSQRLMKEHRQIVQQEVNMLVVFGNFGS